MQRAHPKEVLLQPSRRAGKKFDAVIDGRTVSFGAQEMSDYTMHHDPEQKHRYLLRHQARENWTRSGLETAGFWSRWLLWNEPSLQASKRDMERRFCLRIRT